MSTTSSRTSRLRGFVASDTTATDPAIADPSAALPQTGTGSALPPEGNDSDEPAWKRHWQRWNRWVYAGVGALAFVWAMPMIVAHTPLVNSFVNDLLDDKPGSLTAKDASLGWFSPVVLEGVELHDAEGNLLASAARISTEKSLLSLMSNSSAPGIVLIEQPVVSVKLRSDGSDWEDFLAPWLDENAPKSDPLDAIFRVEGGKAVIVDANGRTWNLQKLEAVATLPADQTQSLTATVAGEMPSGLEIVPLSFALGLPQSEESTENGKLEVKTSGLPLVLVQSVVERYLPDAKLSGELTTDLKAAWGSSWRDNLQVHGSVTMDRLSLTAAALQGDALKLERLHIPCRVTFHGGRVNVQELGVQCDLAELKSHGGFDFDNALLENVLASLAKETYSISGQVNLARLAALLPRTLRVKEGTRVTSGDVQFSLTSNPDGQNHQWLGHVKTSRLAATTSRGTFAWDKPIELAFEARSEAGTLLLPRLACQSDFLEVVASGSVGKLTGSARYDLQQLTAQLGQFVDLGAWQLAGEGQADFEWTRTPEGVFRLGAVLGAKNFHLATPDSPAWVEPAISVQASAAGTLANRELSSLQSADVKVVAAEDQLTMHLTAPIKKIAAETAWPLDVRLQGSIARWLTRLRPIFTPGNLAMDGQCDLVADVAYSSGEVEVRNSRTKITGLELTGYGLFISEPQTQLDAKAKWKNVNRRLEIQQAALQTREFQATAYNAMVEVDDKGSPRMSGQMALSTTLELLQRWVQDPKLWQQSRKLGAWQLAGAVQGQAEFQYQGGKTSGVLNLDGQDIQVIQSVQNNGQAADQVRWSERQAKLISKAIYDQAADHLQLQEASLTTNTLKFDTSGTIVKMMTDCQVDLTGAVDYDLAQLMPLFEEYLGKGITFEGRDSAHFKVRGPLIGTANRQGVIPSWSQRLTAEADATWSKAVIYGVQLGGAKLVTNVAGGQARFAPLDIAQGEGRLTTTPLVRFDPAPSELYLPKGMLANKVRISPEFCDRTLKYVAPVLAQATRTNGQFSVDLEGGRIPPSTPERGDIAGKLQVHKVEVMPGPLANDLILLSQQVEAVLKRTTPPLSLDPNQKPLLTLEDQEIPFRMVEGRIYHQNLKLAAAGTTISTTGSVGFDQTLALTADVPIQDRWLGDDRLVQGFKGQTIRVNIGGTLARPQIDRRTLEQLAGQLVRGAAQNVIQSELDKQLNKILQPRK